MAAGGNYYYLNGGRQQGPVKLSVLMKLLLYGGIDLQTPVKTPTSDRFIPFAETELKAELPELPAAMQCQRNRLRIQWSFFLIPLIYYFLLAIITQWEVHSILWWLLIAFACSPLIIYDEISLFYNHRPSNALYAFLLTVPFINLYLGPKSFCKLPGARKWLVILVFLWLGFAQFAVFFPVNSTFVFIWFWTALILEFWMIKGPRRQALQELNRICRNLNIELPDKPNLWSCILHPIRYKAQTPGWSTAWDYDWRDCMIGSSIFFVTVIVCGLIYLLAFWGFGAIRLKLEFYNLDKQGIIHTEQAFYQKYPEDDFFDLDVIIAQIPEARSTGSYLLPDMVLSDATEYERVAAKVLEDSAGYLAALPLFLQYNGPAPPRYSETSRAMRRSLTHISNIFNYHSYFLLKHQDRAKLLELSRLWRHLAGLSGSLYSSYTDFLAQYISSGLITDEILAENLSWLNRMESMLYPYWEREYEYSRFRNSAYFVDLFWLKPLANAKYWSLAADERFRNIKECHSLPSLENRYRSARSSITHAFYPGDFEGYSQQYSKNLTYLRIGRNLIELELQRRKSGHLPPNPVLSIDPFSGQPLKYQHGEILVDSVTLTADTRNIWHLPLVEIKAPEEEKKPEEEKAPEEESEQEREVRLFFEQWQSEVNEPKEDEEKNIYDIYFIFKHTPAKVNGFRVYSVGQNRIDDNGISDYKNKMDDISKTVILSGKDKP